MDANQRRLLLENQRKKLESELKRDLNDLKNKGKVDISLDKFVTKSDDKASKLAAETVGLVQLDQFQKIKESTLSGSSLSERSEEEIAEQDRKIKQRAAKLSFSLDDDEDEEDQEVQVPAKMARLGPDPSAIAMSQALEIEREMAAKRLEAELEAKRVAEEEAIKKQAIKLNCSFFDGSDRRFILEGFKGDSIAQLLEKAQTAFPPLKGSLVSSLLFIKENVILPHEMTVYDFIMKKAYIRHTQMFDFALDESGIAVDSSKNCKISVKTWYEAHRNDYPAKQWVEFDPHKHTELVLN